MPELPEVETIRTQLQKFLVGRRIEKIEVRVTKIFQEGKEKLLGGKIKGLRRFGKVLVVDLDNGYSFLVHLKLTGQLVFSSAIVLNQQNKFTHVIFSLDGGARLFFNDARKFGWIKVTNNEELKTNNFIAKLGPEPHAVPRQARDLSGQAVLTLEKFKEILSKSSRPIKIILMDQEKISGVGNIYANDALFLAGIRPDKKSNSLSPVEQDKLFKSIEKVLKNGLKYQGASDQWYVTAEGKKGRYQEHFLVYGKAGATCQNCRREKIKRMVIGGRGTFYCPRCQR